MCILYYSSCILVCCCDMNCPDIGLQKERPFVLSCVTVFVSETALRTCWAACAMEPAHGLHSASGNRLWRDPSFVEEARDLASTRLENIQQCISQPLWCPSSLTFKKQESAHEVTCRRKKEKSNLCCKIILQKAGPRLLCLRASLPTSFILVVFPPSPVQPIW